MAGPMKFVAGRYVRVRAARFAAANRHAFAKSTPTPMLRPRVRAERRTETMETIVRIPTPLRTLTGGADEVTAAGGTLAEVIEDLERKHPGIRDRLLDDKGVRRFVNIYVGEEDVRFLDGLKTALKAGDQISIVPAIAGG